MIRTLDRYLLKSFLVNYVLSLAVLISLYVVLDLFVNFDEFTESNKPIGTIVYNIGNFYFYNLPLYFSQLSGVITLFAACATFARLQRQNEITAVLASGTSLYRLAAPIVLAGLVMNALLVVDQELILPDVAPKLVRTRDDVEGARVYEVWFVRDGESRLVSAMQFAPRQGRIRDMIIMELSTDGDPSVRGRMGDVILADKAEWVPDQRGWNLINGRRISINTESAGILGGDHSIRRTPEKFYKTDLTPEELQLRQTAQWVQFLSIRQLAMLERNGDVDPGQIAQIRHTRFTMPINNMILLLLGISFFLTREPSSVLTQGAQALAVCSVSFLIAFAGQQLVGSADVSPALPAWLPILLFGPLAVVLMDSIKT